MDKLFDDTQVKGYKSGFISIIGRPNVGKSTFLNRVIGQKIAIMSDKPQTTRNKVQGVLTQNDSQMIFIDTPGIHKPKHKLGDFMMKVATNTLKEVDLILFMINATEGYGRGDEFIIEKLQSVKTPVFLVVNKIDAMHPDDLLPIIEKYQQLYPFAAVVPISEGAAAASESRAERVPAAPLHAERAGGGVVAPERGNCGEAAAADSGGRDGAGGVRAVPAPGAHGGGGAAA